jgi:hypothetical protein
MITNFEEITEELSDHEKTLIPILVKCFQKYTVSNPITGGEVVRKMNAFKPEYKMSEPRLRKCVNYIRKQAIIPLIATSQGYFVSYDRAIIQSQIKSLHERAGAILSCSTGLSRFINQDKNMVINTPHH